MRSLSRMAACLKPLRRFTPNSFSDS
jgi:hypothetical protein